jgi:hypothetical protein
LGALVILYKLEDARWVRLPSGKWYLFVQLINPKEPEAAYYGRLEA